MYLTTQSHLVYEAIFLIRGVTFVTRAGLGGGGGSDMTEGYIKDKGV